MSEEQGAKGETAPKSSLVMAVIPPVAAGIAAFGLSLWAPWASQANEGPEGAAAAGGADAGDGEEADDAKRLPRLVDASGKAKGKGGKGGGDAALLPLDPLIVSLPEGEDGTTRGRPVRLRISLSVEGNEAILAKTQVVSILLRDEFTATVRAMTPQALGGTGGLEALREALLQSARDALGEDAVSNILITDFLMT